ncbi:MAG: UvrD-helicase domain-containing protein, partial [Firmicutes bacterium]|nr:UvrD-helicase domain-containing protein [Bacillota bacterium]
MVNLDTLNEMQRRAVLKTHGPLLILAGAGSGKTTVLVNKIEFAIKYGNAYYGEEKQVTPADMLLLEQYLKEPEEDYSEYVSRLLACSPPEAGAVMAITFTNKAANELKDRLSQKLGSKAADIWAG